MKDYYEILEVQPTASPEVIHGAYRSLAQTVHPDRLHVSRDSRMYQAMAARMLEINEAYAHLSDPIKRDRYDATYDDKRARALKEQALLQRMAGFKKLAYWLLLGVFLAVSFRTLMAVLALPWVKALAGITAVAALLWWRQKRQGDTAR